MKKYFMLFAACLMAISLSAAELNVFASGLKAVQDGNKVDVTYVLNAPATSGEIQLLGEEDAVVKTFAISDAALLTKGSHTINIDLSEAGIPAGTYNWAVKVTGAANEALTNVVDYDKKLYNYYLPQGLAIDNNPESPFFGRIYVSEATDGASDGATDRTKAMTRGVFIYDALLEDVTSQGTTGYLGGLTGMDPARTAFKRIVVDKDGYVYINSMDAAKGGVYRMDPANPSAAFVPVLDTTKRGTIYTTISSMAVEGAGADKVLYTADNFVASASTGSINKYAIGTVVNYAQNPDSFVVNSSEYALGISDNQFVADGKGGFWGVQNRWGYDVWAAVYHINADKVRDYVIMQNQNTDVLPQTTDVTTYRGVVAINENKTLLAVPTQGRVVVFNIAYDATTGVPTLTEAYRTEKVFGNNIDGLAFDYADNLYVISASKEMFYAYAPVKADNTCITPAPKANTIVIGDGVEPESGMKLVFKTTGTSSDASVKLTAIEDILESGAEYVTLTTATEVYQGREGRGNKLGGSKNAYELVMTLKNPVKPTSIVINAMPYQNENDKANNKMIFMGDTLVLTETGAFADYTISYDGNTEISAISLKALQASSNRVYVTSITINADGGSTPEVLEPKTFYGADSFTTEGSVIDPAVWTAVEWNITRNADKTLSIELTWTNDVTGMVPQINLGAEYINMTVEGKKATYTTTDTYEDGVALEGAFFYLAYAGAAKRIDITYTVGAENEKPETPQPPVVGPKVWNIAPNNNPEAPRDDCNLYVTLERVAGAGDTIILADGEYIETLSLPNNYDVVIKAAEGAHPVIKASGYFQHKANLYLEGIKFVFVGEDGNGYAVYSYENTHKNIVIENCEFTAYTKYVINCSSSTSHVDSCIINNCFFHDNDRAAVYFPASTLADNVHACDYLSITNTTIANITSSSISGYAIIDIRNNKAIEAEADGTELVVDHVTMYNFPTGGNGGIMNYKSQNTTITNTIIANPAETEQYATYCYGGNINNVLVYNLTKGKQGHRQSGGLPVIADTIYADPLFADAANLDFTLSENSPAIGAGTNGSTLGDPRWAPEVGPVEKITYVLGGGITNDYGWTNKADMFEAFMTDAGVAEHPTYAEYYAMDDRLGGQGVCGKLTDVSPAFNMTEKWGWLKQYIVDVTAAQLAASPTPTPTALNVTDGNSAAWRYAVGAFFMDTQRASWPVSADFSVAGSYEAFQPAWKHAFDNPGSVTEETELMAPYLEGFTFLGWYTEPDGQGTKVTTINADTEGTLYAYFVPYINTVAEILAMEDGTKAQQVRGTVTFVQSSNFWIQDATGGILCYGKNHGLQEGEFVTIQGDKTTYNGSPEVENVTVVSHEQGTLVNPLTVMLSAVANVETPHLNKLVYIEGLKMAEYQDAGNYKNPVVTDGVDSIILYNMGITEDAIPVGTKINVKAVVGIYKTTMQLRGHAEWVEVASAAGKDTYNYPARLAEGDFTGYTLENEWIYANTYDNYSDNVPGPTDFVRGMVAKDGIMYFINRSTASFTRVDGATGLMLDPLPITGEHLFQTQGDDGNWSACATLPYNDVKLDNAGHALISGCITGGNRFQIYNVDLTTGAATEVINERLYDSEDTIINKMNYRFDAFGVYGDVTKDATIMACNANGMNAFRWHIKGGVAGKAELIEFVPDDGVKSFIVDNGAWTYAPESSAPQIFPLEGDMFYVDYHGTLPMLFDAGTESYGHPGAYEATLLDDFANVPTGVAVGNAEGDTCKMNQGHNGITEFQVGDDYFLVMAATNTEGTPSSAYALYKFKDSAKSFAEMEPLWYFPANGMGKATAGGRSAVPYVEVEGNVANIYLYTLNNGYAVYTFTGKEGGHGDGVENIYEASKDKAVKVVENGVIYIYRNGVKYNTMGAQVK